MRRGPLSACHAARRRLLTAALRNRADVEPRYETGNAARHCLCDLVGDVSLLGGRGNTGLLCGHIVAHNPDFHLQTDFLRAVSRGIARGDVRPWPFVITDAEAEALEPSALDDGDGPPPEEEARRKAWLRDVISDAEMPAWCARSPRVPVCALLVVCWLLALIAGTQRTARLSLARRPPPLSALREPRLHCIAHRAAPSLAGAVYDCKGACCADSRSAALVRAHR